MRPIIGLLAASILAGCMMTQQSPEEVVATRKRMQSDCQAKGYRPNTEEHQICLQQLGAAHMQSESMKAQVAGTALVGAAYLPLLLSDARLKRDIERLGEVEPGIGLYRFRYLWSED